MTMRTILFGATEWQKITCMEEHREDWTQANIYLYVHMYKNLKQVYLYDVSKCYYHKSGAARA